MQKQRIRRLALGGMLTALVLLMTAIVRIPVPATGGYVHPGDGVILFAGLLLGPYAGIIGGIGSALADVLGGYFIYVAPTFCIKGVMGIIAGIFAKEDKPRFNVLVFSGAACVMVVGYFIAECLMVGWAAALAAVLPNVMQGATAVILGLMLSALPIKRFLQ